MPRDKSKDIYVLMGTAESAIIDLGVNLDEFSELCEQTGIMFCSEMVLFSWN